MRNLIVLIYRYHIFFLFLALEAISLGLVFNFNSFQRASLIEKTQEVVGGSYNVYYELSKFLTLRRVNDSLSAEIADLKAQQLHPSDSQISKETLVKEAENGLFELIPARVINNSVLKRNNYITLNRGRGEGIEENLGVINRNGIVGIIQGASEHYASGISLLHSEFTINARIRDLKENGSLRWDGRDPEYAVLEHIPRHVELKKGLVVEVSAYSYMFPEGIAIGEISEFSLEEGASFYDIRIHLANDFRKLDYVYVVRNHYKEEKELLEKSVMNE